MNKEFLRQDGISLAKDILGKFLIRKYDGKTLVCKITETEAYMGITDKAAHVYNDKKTDRTKPLYLDGGHVYVYLIYGMYFCLNLSANEEGIPECVLIRGIEPVYGIDEICKNRFNKNFNELNSYQKKNIGNGPGKVCMALKIDKSFNCKYILDEDFYISDYYYDGNEKIYADSDLNIKVGKRINIDYSEEAKDYPWRFYL